MIPLISPSPPRPVAEVQLQPADPAAFAGPTAVIIFTQTGGRYAAFHPDLGVVNNLAPIPISTVVYIDEAMAVGGDDDPMAFYHPLVGKGELTVLAERGELPPFEWEF